LNKVTVLLFEATKVLNYVMSFSFIPRLVTHGRRQYVLSLFFVNVLMEVEMRLENMHVDVDAFIVIIDELSFFFGS